MDSIKFHITFTITQKYAVELLISVPVTNIKKQRFKSSVIQKLMSNAKWKQVKKGMLCTKHYLW